MSMTKPIALSKNAFDSTQDEIFYFSASGGNQVVKNKLTIRNNATNVVVYTNTVETFQFQQAVPSNTLTNGTYYNFYFNTYDVNNNESENSNVISFYCYTQPTVTFTNLIEGQIINNASFNCGVQYSQEQGELLDFLSINLYSTSNLLIATSGNLYSSQVPPIDFSYLFNGLENNRNYKIQSVAVSVNGTVTYSDMINFIVSYKNPTLFSRLNLENKCDDGYVQVRSNIIIADGESNIEPMVYINNTMADVRFPQNYIKWNQGYQINKDFEVSIWIKPTWIYKFAEVFSSQGNGYTIKFVREMPYGETAVKDYFELSGYIGGELKVYQRSNYVDIMTTNDYVLLWIKKVGTNYTLTLDIITKGDLSYIDWGIGNSNVEYNTLTSLSWGEESYTQGTQPTLLNNDMDSIFPLTNFELYGNIYDNLDITKDTTKTISESFPTWDYNTELNCDFNNNINGGNVNITLSQLSGLKIKRREYGTFEWMTIYERSVSSITDLYIDIQDSYIPSGNKFQWAIVPILNGGIEGDYIIEDLDVILNGTFLSNGDNIFKLYNSVVLGQGVQNVRIGQLQPIGLEYPILIQNGKVNNYSNTLTANLYGYNFEETRRIDRNDVIKQADDFLKFVTNGKSFCITDWNGNIWIGKTNVAPILSYNNSYGNGVITVNLSFVEQGKYNNQRDMKNNGLLNVQTN